MIVAACISITLSYLGGFDLVNNVTSVPVKQEPVLQDVEVVRQRYQRMVDEANRTASDYYERRKYRGRIASKDAGKYQEYLDKKLLYQDSLLSAVAAAVHTTKRKKKR